MPKPTTARTTRSDRMPYRKSRSTRLDIGTSGLLLVIPSRGSLGRGEHAPERPDELGEFERQDEFRGGGLSPRPEGVPRHQAQTIFIEPPPRPQQSLVGVQLAPPLPKKTVAPALLPPRRA